MGLATLDIIVAIAVLLFAVIGFFKGFLAQVLSILALIVAYLLSRPLGKAIAGIIARNSDNPNSSSYVLGSFLALLIIYAGIKLIIHYTCKFLRGKRSDVFINNLLGAAFGGAKAFAVAWICLCTVAAFPARFQGKSPDIYAMLHGSRMETIIRKWNPVGKSRIADSFRQLEVIARDPQAFQRLKKDPNLARLLSIMERKLKAEVTDAETRRRIQDGDMSSIMRIEKLWSIFRDPEVAEALKKVDLGDALAEASKK